MQAWGDGSVANSLKDNTAFGVSTMDAASFCWSDAHRPWAAASLVLLVVFTLSLFELSPLIYQPPPQAWPQLSAASTALVSQMTGQSPHQPMMMVPPSPSESVHSFTSTTSTSALMTMNRASMFSDPPLSPASSSSASSSSSSALDLTDIDLKDDPIPALLTLAAMPIAPSSVTHSHYLRISPSVQLMELWLGLVVAIFMPLAAHQRKVSAVVFVSAAALMWMAHLRCLFKVCESFVQKYFLSDFFMKMHYFVVFFCSVLLF
jgi:hypothetical protein